MSNMVIRYNDLDFEYKNSRLCNIYYLKFSEMLFNKIIKRQIVIN
jgi:hypothetical protein